NRAGLAGMTASGPPASPKQGQALRAAAAIACAVALVLRKALSMMSMVRRLLLGSPVPRGWLAALLCAVPAGCQTIGGPATECPSLCDGPGRAHVCSVAPVGTGRAGPCRPGPGRHAPAPLIETDEIGRGDWIAATRPLSFREDRQRFLPLVWDDARAAANWRNGVVLLAALGGSIALRDDVDDDIRETTARHPQRWGDATDALGVIGEAPFQVAVLLGAYSWSLHQQDRELHDVTTTLARAFTVNGLTVLAIKGIANTERPSRVWNSGRFGFPSYHAASAFTIAAVMEEYYGLEVGLPCYALAGLVSWSRVDARDHDLSDVVFGAALGYVIGKSVAGRHLRGDSRVRLSPYVHPSEGAGGIALDCEF
ncbi:MAG: phosphatase PAP2 family protein, partial [Planctomycetaceae bacterium]